MFLSPCKKKNLKKTYACSFCVILGFEKHTRRRWLGLRSTLMLLCYTYTYCTNITKLINIILYFSSPASRCVYYIIIIITYIYTYTRSGVHTRNRIHIIYETRVPSASRWCRRRIVTVCAFVDRTTYSS